MILVVPGNIIHSNNVNPDEMAIGMMQNPAWQQLGLPSEAGLLAVKLLLAQLNTKSLTVEPPARSQPIDVQTINMEVDAEIKRKAEEGDDEYTDQPLDEEEKGTRRNDTEGGRQAHHEEESEQRGEKEPKGKVRLGGS